MRRRITLVLLTICFIVFSGAEASSAKLNLPDLTQKGEIRMSFHPADKVTSGGSVTAFYAGEIKVDDGNYFYVLSDEFKESTIDISNIQREQLPEELWNYAKAKNIEGITVPVQQDGTAVFSDLPLGLYLLTQNEPVKGYYPVAPFVLTLPSQEEGEWVYTVNADPKTEVTEKPEPTPPPKPVGPKLPQTGQLKWPVPFLALGGILIFSVGLRLYLKKDGYSDEK